MTVFTLVILTGYLQIKPHNNTNDGGFDLVDKTGNIRKPADYRDRYQALGTWAVNDRNGNTDMHYTYASPGTAEYYRKTGKFADGTVLVKEIFATDHGQLTFLPAETGRAESCLGCIDRRLDNRLEYEARPNLSWRRGMSKKMRELWNGSIRK